MDFVPVNAMDDKLQISPPFRGRYTAIWLREPEQIAAILAPITECQKRVHQNLVLLEECFVRSQSWAARLLKVRVYMDEAVHVVRE